MKVILNSTVVITMILTCCVLWAACAFPVALSCDSCGRECASACGTRHFRTCCFNYLRKRSVDTPPIPYQSPGTKLDYYLSRSQVERAVAAAKHKLMMDNDLNGLYYPFVLDDQPGLAKEAKYIAQFPSSRQSATQSPNDEVNSDPSQVNSQSIKLIYEA